MARVSPPPLVLRSCSDQITVTVWPGVAGETDIDVTITLNSRFGSFPILRAPVRVVVAPAIVAQATATPQPVGGGGGTGGGGGVGGGGGFSGGPNPAQTPELGSLILFGSGALGLGGYAFARLRANRGRKRSE